MWLFEKVSTELNTTTYMTPDPRPTQRNCHTKLLAYAPDRELSAVRNAQALKYVKQAVVGM